jgi:hypothetical protein
MTAPIRSMPEISDKAWDRVHAAVEAYDPKRYAVDAKETDDLLQAIFEVIVDELERGHRIGHRRKGKKR